MEAAKKGELENNGAATFFFSLPETCFGVGVSVIWFAYLSKGANDKKNPGFSQSPSGLAFGSSVSWMYVRVKSLSGMRNIKTILRQLLILRKCKICKEFYGIKISCGMTTTTLAMFHFFTGNISKLKKLFVIELNEKKTLKLDQIKPNVWSGIFIGKFQSSYIYPPYWIFSDSLPYRLTGNFTILVSQKLQTDDFIQFRNVDRRILRL